MRMIDSPQMELVMPFPELPPHCEMPMPRNRRGIDLRPYMLLRLLEACGLCLALVTILRLA